MSSRETSSGAPTGGAANTLECPICGRVRVETPPGTTALPTLGMARKAAGAAGQCDCGEAPHTAPEELAHEPGAPGGPGTATTDETGARDADEQGASDADETGAHDADEPR